MIKVKHPLWQFSSLVIALLMFLPIVTLLVLAVTSNDSNQDIWSHLSQTVLTDYVSNSLILAFGVAITTGLVGVGCAWLVTQYSFTGAQAINWLLLLPLAMPTYIIAYSYTGLLDIAGPLQNTLRNSFGLQYGDYWFPEIRSIGGAIFVMSFVLYPYVYLLARTSFLSQSQHLRDVAQLLGYSRTKAFFKITLPIARPAVVAGISVVLMETLADFGAVSYFGVNTFTTGIFRTWYGLDSVSGAAQLALLLLSFVVILVVTEKYSRRKERYHSKKVKHIATPETLTGTKASVALLLCATPVILGFIIPVTQLLIWAAQRHTQLFEASFWQLVNNTVSLAAITSVIALILALILAYGHRIANSHITNLSRRIAALGYAIPGLVIAVGVLIPLARFDNSIDAWFRAHFDISTGLLLSGSVVALIIAYLVRFLALSLQTVEAGLTGIAHNMDQAARSLGSAPFRTLTQIHVPILRGSLLTALLIVFVDVMKELPATLVLRPFNFNTLAVRAYELASDEHLPDAAMASITIVLVGLLPVILLTKAINSGQVTDNSSTSHINTANVLATQN